jgi:hypothetical protein
MFYAAVKNFEGIGVIHISPEVKVWVAGLTVAVAFALVIIDFQVTGHRTTMLLPAYVTKLTLPKEVLVLVNRSQPWREETQVRRLEGLKARLVEVERNYLFYEASRDFILKQRDKADPSAFIDLLKKYSRYAHDRWANPRLRYLEQVIEPLQQEMEDLQMRIDKVYSGDVEDEIRKAQTELKKLNWQLANVAFASLAEKQAVQEQIFDLEADIESLESVNYRKLHEELGLPGSSRITTVPNEKLSSVRDRVRTAEEIKKSVPPKPPEPKPEQTLLTRDQRRAKIRAEIKQIQRECEEDLEDIPADPLELREQHRQEAEDKILKKMHELSRI